MRLLGQSTSGVYKDDPMDGVHPDIIDRYYGVAGPEQERGSTQTGAGHPDSEDEDDEVLDSHHEGDMDEELENRVGADQAHNIRHEPIRVARHRNPFRTDEKEAEFLNILAMVVRDELVPVGYGVLADEWDDGNYSELEIIKPGTKGKEIEVVLPREIWLPRAIYWTQALDLMGHLLIDDEESDSDSGTVDDSDES